MRTSKINWKDERNNLIKLINIDNKPYEEIGRMYKCSGTNIKKVAKRLGIELTARRVVNPCETFSAKKAKTSVCLNCGKEYRAYYSSMEKFCSMKCSGEYFNKRNIEMWLNGEISGTQKYGYSSFIRQYLFKLNNNKCQICGWGEINSSTNKIPLQIHHIDGDCLNNKIDNLQLLCPNCHSLTANYGSRNKNATKGRSAYYGKAKKG